MAAGVGFVLFLWLLVSIWTTEVGLTNERLIYKRGFLYRDTKEIQLRAVEEAALSQGIWGRLFNFGQITVHGTGGEDLALPVLADPIAIRRFLEEAMTQVGRGLGAYSNSAKA
ncbi:MAG: PH domain-containing protein [Hyphomicrobium sp.]|nr:PH domain-containing protein [Hyphomicrobium sp.]